MPGYYIEATSDGYRLSWGTFAHNGAAIVLTQEGGGDPLERLFGDVEQTFNRTGDHVRSLNRARRRENDVSAER